MIATSALWNVMTPRDVFDFVGQNIVKGPGRASKLLGQKVKDLYMSEN